MPKKRIETHLKEDASEAIIKKLLPAQWVIRKLHPDYGVDVTIEVFEKQGNSFPSVGEFLFVQFKSTGKIKTSKYEVRARGNVEKAIDREDGEVAFELDVIDFVVDSDTIDNARLMGPSTPLMLFLCDLENEEVYFVCLTDYYDKLLEPRVFDFTKQESVTIKIPAANKLSSVHAQENLRFYASRAKLYGMFNLAQFQYREIRNILHEFSTVENMKEITSNYAIIERFARRLRAMPVWERETPWALIPHYRQRLDLILKNIDADAEEIILAGLNEFMKGNDQAITPLFEFEELCRVSWEQFSAIGQTFEDITREWFLPTYVGQAGSGEAPYLREVMQKVTGK